MDSSTIETTTVSQNPVTGQVSKSNVVSTKRGNVEDFFIDKTNQIIYTLVAILNLFIFLRFIFLLLGANRVGFVTFILNLTNIFVAPAQGIFPSQALEGGYFEAASLVAILMWLILATILAVVIKLFSSKTEQVV